eukprot:CAMPEP_0172301516 /NCGR_PEP_ID=MMETSP1058-20130122/3391_1 /TAXON_ID=83371 /ORGANISM="Detonula confervacea, Strain CCMP 353" /LENGTH=446 /DNA_ID=CAMNT_0013011659 /DNA_START=97 /DNA_END=1437 /DNA_ORIENTATION=+
MKLLSKWRASKRSSSTFGIDRQNTLERQNTPRQLAVLNEAGEEADEPLSPLACCVNTNAVDSINGSQTQMNTSRTKGGYQQYSENTDAPFDEENANQRTKDQQQWQQQPHIIKELFHFFTRRSWKKKLLTILVILTIIPVILDIFILRSDHVKDFLDSFLEWMAEYPLLGVWAYVFMVMLTSLIFIPPSILIFAAGFTFQSLWGSSGILIALVSSYLGSMMGGLIGFWRAKYMTRDLIEVLMRRYPIIKAVDVAVVKNSLRVMVLMRLNCLIPFGVLNYVFGITGVNWAEFLLAMVGILPWHLLLICLGASSASMYDESKQTTLIGVILTAMGVAFGMIGLAITWTFAKKELQKEVDSAQPTTANDYRLSDRNLFPYRSQNRSIAEPTPATNNSIEEADLNAAEYFIIQCMGENNRDVEAVDDDGIEEEEYQAKLNWNEVLLDDFS